MISLSLTNRFNYLYGLQVLAVAVFVGYFRASYKNIWQIPDRSAPLVGLVTFAVWLSLSKPGTPQIPSEHLSPIFAALWILLRLLGSICIAPFSEELAFRGYLMRRLVSVDFDKVSWSGLGWLPVLVSSACFAALHQDVLAALMTGLIYAVYLRNTSKLSNVILAHATTNLCLSAQVLLLSDWGRW